jgi:serine/threonine protein kinase
MISLPPTPPDAFPEPAIGHASMLRTVRVNGRRAQVLQTEKHFYEISIVLSPAIYGKVVLAFVVTPLPTVAGNSAPPTVFVRTTEERAIKVYSQQKLLEQQGNIPENPLVEIAALQFVGDNHPNIMGQIDCCMDQNSIYSVMRCVPGGELFDFIDQHGPLEVPLARSMIKQVLNGLLHLHEQGIGHRDMSLENMLFDGDDHFEIIDFGACLRLKRDPATGLFHYLEDHGSCGKPYYTAPEVVRGDDVFDPRLCDIWAAGVMLFIALTGIPPVETASENDASFLAICEGRLQKMVDAWALDVDPAAVHLIQQILNPNPRVSR